MFDSRFHILCIAPYEGLGNSIEQLAETYSNVKIDVYIGDLEEGAKFARTVRSSEYDCIISRGGTSDLIKKISNIPAIEIPLSVYDILRTIKLAENYKGTFAIVGFPSITTAAHILCDLLRYDLKIITIHSAAEAEQVLEKLKNDSITKVVCDTIAYNTARKMELQAFLITSGVESLKSAIEQAITLSTWFRRFKRENIFVNNAMFGENGCTVALDENQQVFYSMPSELSEELLNSLRLKIPQIPEKGTLKFYVTGQIQLYLVTAQRVYFESEMYSLFYCLPAKISLHSYKNGIRFFNKEECEQLFTNSFYNLSGAMGEMRERVLILANANQPIMITGEKGTGKEQIARFLYLHSHLNKKPFVEVACELTNEKSWDFLLNHDNSPLNMTRNTIYFKNLEKLPNDKRKELVSTISDTGIAQRIRLIFSFTCQNGKLWPETLRTVTSELGCTMLNMPTLRSRVDEIPSLANLYLSSLNIELGKQISGFEPNAIAQLRIYDWPNNYTQFKNLIFTLATLTTSNYIKSALVTELLIQEHALLQNDLPMPNKTNNDHTLEEFTKLIIQKTVAAHNGNRTAAAKQLGISRATLWRYLK